MLFAPDALDKFNRPDLLRCHVDRMRDWRDISLVRFQDVKELEEVVK